MGSLNELISDKELNSSLQKLSDDELIDLFNKSSPVYKPPSIVSGLAQDAKDYYQSLHEPTEPATSVRDFATRVLPASAGKTAVGMAEFPYHLAKSFTDPLLTRKPLSGMQDALLSNIEGYGEFLGKPIGTYGWSELKKSWLTNPVGSAIALSSFVKPIVNKTGRTEISNSVKQVLDKAKKSGVYDKVPFIGEQLTTKIYDELLKKGMTEAEIIRTADGSGKPRKSFLREAIKRRSVGMTNKAIVSSNKSIPQPSSTTQSNIQQLYIDKDIRGKSTEELINIVEQNKPKLIETEQGFGEYSPVLGNIQKEFRPETGIKEGVKPFKDAMDESTLLTPEEQLQRKAAYNEDVIRKNIPPQQVVDKPISEMTPQEQLAYKAENIRRYMLGEALLPEVESQSTGVISKPIQPIQSKGVMQVEGQVQGQGQGQNEAGEVIKTIPDVSGLVSPESKPSPLAVTQPEASTATAVVPPVTTKVLTAQEAKASGLSFDEWVKGQEVFYHGTTKSFDKFEADVTGGVGTYLTPDKKSAELWAGKDFRTKKIPGQIKEVYINIKNPAPLDLVKSLLDAAKGGNPRKQVVSKLKELGYDGIIRPNIETIVFYPNFQIKSHSQLKAEWDTATDVTLPVTKAKTDTVKNNIEMELNITKKGNAVGFTKEGYTITIGYKPSSKTWYVHVIDDQGNVQLPIEDLSHNFPTKDVAGQYALNIMDYDKTKEKAWWDISGLKQTKITPVIKSGNLKEPWQMTKDEVYNLDIPFRKKDKLPVRTVGYRYGAAPESGRSYNSRENKYEEGISLASAAGRTESKSFATMDAAAKRKKYYYEGDIIGYGGDDEPIMVNAKKITAKEYENELKKDAVGKLFLASDNVQIARRLMNRGFVGYDKEFSIRSEFLDKIHKDIIQQALSEGKPVPQEVLKDYPELQPNVPSVQIDRGLPEEASPAIKESSIAIPEALTKRFYLKDYEKGRFLFEGYRSLKPNEYQDIVDWAIKIKEPLAFEPQSKTDFITRLIEKYAPTNIVESKQKSVEPIPEIPSPVKTKSYPLRVPGLRDVISGEYEGMPFHTDGSVILLSGLKIKPKTVREVTDAQMDDIIKALPNFLKPTEDLHTVNKITFEDIRTKKVSNDPIKKADKDNAIDVHLTTGDISTTIDQDYYNYIKKHYPDAIFKIREEPESPIIIYNNNEAVGVVMPIIKKQERKRYGSEIKETPEQYQNKTDWDISTQNPYGMPLENKIYTYRIFDHSKNKYVIVKAFPIELKGFEGDKYFIHKDPIYNNWKITAGLQVERARGITRTKAIENFYKFNQKGR
ncbi:MAG: protein of unknown function DUF3990 [Podoviridae sp. cty5g4]|nr:MAG: protein of unknown function DUF3990 [Podoviridae sp. cty5g4]